MADAGALLRRRLADAAAAQPPAQTAVLAALLAVLLVPRFRRLAWDVAETFVASVLLLVLVLVVLGLPLGAAYITFRGALFILASLSATFPQIRELTGLLNQHGAS